MGQSVCCFKNRDAEEKPAMPKLPPGGPAPAKAPAQTADEAVPQQELVEPEPELARDEAENCDEVETRVLANGPDSARVEEEQGPLTAGVRVEALEAFETDDDADHVLKVDVGDVGIIESMDDGWAHIDFDKDHAQSHWIDADNVKKLRRIAGEAPLKAGDRVEAVEAFETDDDEAHVLKVAVGDAGVVESMEDGWAHIDFDKDHAQSHWLEAHNVEKLKCLLPAED